jgi:cyclic pyranopterin phosphate synthase
MSEFSHIDANNKPTMVDVGHKAISRREATAISRIALPAPVLAAFKDGEIASKKGPVLATAIIAGTMGVKRTSDLIPFCHPLSIESCKIDIALHGAELIVTCTVALSGKTGVEMEALTGASVAALTIYDMCKALSHDMVILETKLIAKSGGKSDIGGAV